MPPRKCAEGPSVILQVNAETMRKETHATEQGLAQAEEQAAAQADRADSDQADRKLWQRNRRERKLKAQQQLTQGKRLVQERDSGKRKFEDMSATEQPRASMYWKTLTRENLQSDTLRNVERECRVSAAECCEHGCCLRTAWSATVTEHGCPP